MSLSECVVMLLYYDWWFLGRVLIGSGVCLCVSCGALCVCVCVYGRHDSMMDGGLLCVSPALSSLYVRERVSPTLLLSHMDTHTSVCPRKDVRCEILPCITLLIQLHSNRVQNKHSLGVDCGQLTSFFVCLRQSQYRWNQCFSYTGQFWDLKE